MTTTIEINSNSFDEIIRLANGARKSTRQSRQNDKLIQDYTNLEDYQVKERWELLDILRRVGHRFGLTAELIHHLDYLMRTLPSDAWCESEIPICYKSVINHAQDLNITERAVRHRERRLSDLGFLAYHDSSNGRRYAQKCSKTGRILQAFGVSLIPLILRADEIRQIDYAERVYREQWKLCRIKINSIRRRILSLFKDIAEREIYQQELVKWVEEFEKVAPVRAGQKLETLQDRLTRYVELQEDIEAILSLEDDLGKTSELTQQISATAETDCRHIDTHTDIHLSFGDYCNDPVDEMGETSPRVNVFREDKGEIRSSGAEYLLPKQVYEAACRDFREAIDRVSGNAFPSDLTVQDIVSAGDYLKNYLSISSGTWHRALSELGQYGAAISLMLACRTHIRSSNAYMIGLLKRHRKGELHLQRTVFGQLFRSEEGIINFRP